MRDVVALPFCGDAAWLAVEENVEAVEAAKLVDPDGLAALRSQCAALREDVVIIDWDSICLGPPAWDHAPVITWEERWGGAGNPTYAAEAKKRMRYWLGDTAAPMWTPL